MSTGTPESPESDVDVASPTEDAELDNVIDIIDDESESKDAVVVQTANE